ncbi:MAG: hypothetical protein SFV18_17640 [Bryobacteraceae bacterium]|nr:hypothetical protein [Bryobacteraceae bacterium]
MTRDKETLPSSVCAKPEFTALTEDEVWKTVRADPENEQAVTAEVNRLVAVYTRLYFDCVQRNGPVPPHILYVRAEWPIERVAVSIVVDRFKDASSSEEPVTIH